MATSTKLLHTFLPPEGRGSVEGLPPVLRRKLSRPSRATPLDGVFASGSRWCSGLTLRSDQRCTVRLLDPFF